MLGRQFNTDQTPDRRGSCGHYNRRRIIGGRLVSHWRHAQGIYWPCANLNPVAVGERARVATGIGGWSPFERSEGEFRESCRGFVWLCNNARTDLDHIRGLEVDVYVSEVGVVMTDLQNEIQRQKEIIEKATEGPWRYDGLEVYASGGHNVAKYSDAGMYDATDIDPRDCEFIAESRTAWPRVLEALERAVFRLNQAENYLRQGKAQFSPNTTNSDVDIWLENDPVVEIESILKVESDD